MRIREFLQNLPNRYVRRVFCVVDLAKGHIVEAGGVLEEIGDADGIRRFPRVSDRDLWRDVLQAGLQIDAAFFFEPKQRKGDEGFADGADTEFGVAGDVAILREVGFADATAPENLAVGDESDTSAGDMFVVEDFFCSGLKFFERFGMREFVFFRGRLLGEKQGRRGEKD